MKSKFDVQGTSAAARLRHTLVFTGYVVMTMAAWLVYGGLVRRSYRRAQREGRTFHVDRLPGGVADDPPARPPARPPDRQAPP